MKFFNKINKAIATTALSTGLLATTVLGANMVKNARDYTVYALPYGSQEISKITDNDFENFSGVTYGSPSNWTVTSDSDTSNSDRFVSGIMNLTSSTAWSSNYEDNFHLAETDNPDDGSTTDKNYLYMNNYSTAPIKYGYASESFSLSKNSYYHISVRLKTTNSENAKASLYITGGSDTIKMEDIYTNGTWKEYTFYIATNSISDLSSIQLEVWLGSKTSGSCGAVFVDSVRVFQYDESTFTSTTNKDSSTSVYTNLNEKVSIPFANNGFESDLTGWTLSASNSIDSSNQLISSVQIGNGFNSNLTDTWGATNPYTINTFNNDRALLIANKTSLISGVESPKISIKQHGLYRLSVWAYSDCDTGNGATILVKEIGLGEEALAYNTLSVSKTTTTNAVNSNWTEYSVYIQGSAFSDTSVKLCLFLGTPAIGDTEASPTNGYVYFDEVKIQELDYSSYSTAVENMSNAVELNITSSDTQYLVPNGDFNKAKNEKNSVVYPLAPNNFSKTMLDIDGNTITEAKTYSGIVNINTVHWNNNKSNYPADVVNPGTFNGKSTDESTNNVLMIGTNNPTIKQVYSSETFDLSASSYYKVSFYVQTQILPQYNTGVTVKFYNGSNYIYKSENINTHGEWQYIEFYIKTGDSALTSTFDLSLDYTNGYAFFDELHVESFESEDAFNSIVTSSDKVFDLTYETFDTQNTFNGYFNGTFTDNEKEMVNHGITSINGNNVLYISSTVDTYFTFSSSKTYSFTSGSYYKLSVDVYTLYLSQEEQNHVYDKDNNNKLLPYGVTLALKDSDGTFIHSIENVNTDTLNNGNNKFTTYTFYIKANQDISTYLYLSLGNEDSYVSGTVYFDNIRFTTSTQEEYDADKLDSSLEDVSLFIEDTTEDADTDVDDDEENTEENEEFEFPWILISSLITGLAIIIAIVGYFIRKVKFQKAPKIKTSYDRRKTLDVELDRRERIAMRQSMIEELKLQLHTIDDEIAAIKEMFDVKEAQILINDKARREQITNDKNAIISKREDATKEYKSILNSDASDKEKEVAEKHFARYIAKLNKQEEQLQKLLEQKETSSALLKLKREQQLQRFIDAQLEIQKEIERIEAEIEQIAKEDEQIWAEYKQAKAEAKERKTAYIQEKKLEKAKAKTESKKSSKKSKDNKSEDK